MNAYKKAVMEYFKAKGIKYIDVSDERLKVIYNGDNLRTITTTITFPDDDGLVRFDNWEIAKVPEQKVENAIRACNSVNDGYLFVKFFVDEDRDYRAQLDAYLSMSNAGSVCHEYVRAMVNVTDTVYPILQKACWD